MTELPQSLLIFLTIVTYLLGIYFYNSWLQSEGVHHNYINDTEYLARLLVWPVILLLRVIQGLGMLVYYILYVGLYRSFIIVFKGEDK